jgi:hypothetical protein
MVDTLDPFQFARQQISMRRVTAAVKRRDGKQKKHGQYKARQEKYCIIDSGALHVLPPC